MLFDRRGTWLVLGLILVLAAYVRLAQRDDNPGWYSDEGTHLEIAQRLRQGQMGYMALGQSTLLVSRLPLFEYTLAAMLAVFGDGIDTLRGLTGTLGVISVAVLFGCVWSMTRNRRLALLAAFALAIYPGAILYSRFGFSYNLLVPLVLLAYGTLWHYLRSGRRRFLALAAMFIGIGALSDLWMLSLFAVLGIVVLRRRWRDMLWAVPLMILPFALYLLSIYVRSPEALTTDWQFVFFRISNLSLPQQAENIALNYTILLSQDFWFPAAMIGFFLLGNRDLIAFTLLTFFVPLMFIGRTVALYQLSAHYMIPLLPFVALGAAALIEQGVPWLWRLWRQWVGGFGPTLTQCGALAMASFSCGAPLVVTLVLNMRHVQTRFPTSIDPFLVNAETAYRVADYVNAQAQKADLVIVSPSISWLIRARTADYQMSIAATGQGTPHYPPNMPFSRWDYDPRFEKARYVVIDNFWRLWGLPNIEGLAAATTEIERWPKAFEDNGVTVYRHP